MFQNHKDCQTAALAGVLNVVWGRERGGGEMSSSSSFSSSSSSSSSSSPSFSFDNAPYSANEIGEVMDYYLRREVVKILKGLEEEGEREGGGRGEGEKFDWEGLKQNIVCIYVVIIIYYYLLSFIYS